ncbi:MAG TPA: hypothetical protein VFC00_26200 [Micromonosporaceae bacterium]|nr:hypothetical protein [Micromonosporaceae bacterium]
MSAVELFPEGTTARRAPAAPYEWPLMSLATVMGSGDDLVDDPRVGWMSYVDSGS